MKLAILFILISFSLSAQFQSLENADWTFHRKDHQLHYFGSIGLTILVSGFSTYADLDNPNIKKGLINGAVFGGGVAIAKEVIWDLAFSLGAPTYPDLVYSFAGVAVGLATTYLMYKIDKYFEEKFKL
jgi:hypothetical protein